MAFISSERSPGGAKSLRRFRTGTAFILATVAEKGAAAMCS
jgi:hypothetical protein